MTRALMMMKHRALLVGFIAAAQSSQHIFSVHDDIFAYPQVRSQRFAHDLSIPTAAFGGASLTVPNSMMSSSRTATSPGPRPSRASRPVLPMLRGREVLRVLKTMERHRTRVPSSRMRAHSSTPKMEPIRHRMCRRTR